MIKTLRKLGIEGIYLNIVKPTYEKPITNIILFLFIYSYVHVLFRTYCPYVPHTLLLTLLPLLLPGRTCSALLSNFVEEKTYAIIRNTKHFC
jgi:hypothetical protein